MTRTLAIMGSGETTTGMLAVHRAIFATLPDDADCRMIDSPFAFQENADELVERIDAYFSQSLGHPLRRVVLPATADELTREQALADMRAADWIFAGPGSPSYARRCWADTAVPDVLAGVVAPGSSGALVIASAAAVTLGRWALPVYEIYKVGEDPRWEPGLDLMSRLLGWQCAVVPHYDNKEGGTHDTRFCYVGERRLAMIESELAAGFLLGIDEHTALVFDLDSGTATVGGRGVVTLRVAGVEHQIPTGSRVTVAELEEHVRSLGGSVGAAESGVAAGARSADVGPRSSLDPRDWARAVLDQLPTSAAAERAAVVALLARADEVTAAADRHQADRAVQAIVDLRSESRSAGDYAASDRLRDVLVDLGVEIRDADGGSTWLWA